VKVLEALKILEEATLDCKKRPIKTPEVNEALDTIERYVDTEWRIKSFRGNLARLT
jgi:hemerythrin-like domain-containing protein